jgi:fructose 1,6-bisphosphate aldolase/phosphatase
MNALALIGSFLEHMARSPSLFQRLHSVAGKYTGKDDPVAIVRNQGIFPAPEEIISPFAKAHFVGGDARGSHVMPLMPVPLNTPVTGIYCLPIVSCAGFSIDKNGRDCLGLAFHRLHLQ